MREDVNYTGVLVCSGLKHEILPATLAIPKALYPLGETPLILIGLSRLYSLGIRKVVVVVSRSDRTAIECLIGNGEILGMSVIYYYQDVRLGLAHLINSLLTNFQRIVLRMVDFLDSNLSTELLDLENNLVFKSNSIYHFFDAEFVLSSDVKLNEDFDDSIKSSKLIDVRESRISNPLYLYNSDNLVTALTTKKNEILEHVYINFGKSFLYKLI